MGVPPRRLRAHYPDLIKLSNELPYTVAAISKLSRACDPESSEIAVAINDAGELIIIGLVDQELQVRKSRSHQRDGHFRRPGIVQVEITGVGLISVYQDNTLVGGLHKGKMASTYLDVMRRGPVYTLLKPYITHCLARIAEELGPSFRREVWWADNSWDLHVQEKWLGALSRVILIIQANGHGGALLLSAKRSTRTLGNKYKIQYHKIESLIVQEVVAEIRGHHAWWTVHDDYCENQKKEIPIDLYFDATISQGDREDAVDALDSAIMFVAALANVDGLVLLKDGLNVAAFGVEIRNRTEPDTVYRATDEKATVRGLQRVDINTWGTRHRSMIRYCHANPGSVGFIISQDGDVRAVSKVGQRTVIWEDIAIQNVQLPQRTVPHQRTTTR